MARPLLLLGVPPLLLLGLRAAVSVVQSQMGTVPPAPRKIKRAETANQTSFPFGVTQ